MSTDRFRNLPLVREHTRGRASLNLDGVPPPPHCYNDVLYILQPPEVGYYGPHFTDEATEAQRGWLTCPGSHSHQVTESRLIHVAFLFQCPNQHHWVDVLSSSQAYESHISGTATVQDLSRTRS